MADVRQPGSREVDKCILIGKSSDFVAQQTANANATTNRELKRFEKVMGLKEKMMNCLEERKKVTA